MKKFLFLLVLSISLLSCGTAYNSALKQIQLGMTQTDVVSLMGDNYNVVEYRNDRNQTIQYRDRYKNNWYFEFYDGRLYKWYKTTDE